MTPAALVLDFDGTIVDTGSGALHPARAERYVRFGPTADAAGSRRPTRGCPA